MFNQQIFNNQQNSNNTQQNVETMIVKKNSVEFYTGKSMLVIEKKPEDTYVTFTILPAIGQQKYDSRNKISTKMSQMELGVMIDALQSYRLMGSQGFNNVCNMMNTKQQNQFISFYHESNKYKTIISLGPNKYGALMLFFSRTEKQTNNQNQVSFTILPQYRFLLERALITFLDMTMEVIKEIQVRKPQQNQQYNQQQNYQQNNQQFGTLFQ